jgi:hypothetical protein
MSEEANQPIPPATAGPEGQQGVGVLLDERELRSVYVNSYRIHAAQEEVVLDLIFSMPNPNPAAPGNAQMLWKVTDRAIMSYASAKRLAMSLAQLVKRYEQQFGEVPMQGPRR